MTKGKNIHVYTITLPERVWSSSLSDTEADIYHKNLTSQELVSISTYDMLKLKHLFLSYLKIIETTPKILNQESFRKKIEEQVLYAITRSLSIATNSHSSHSTRKTTQKVWDKLDVILKKVDDTLIPVHDLCLAAGVSERSLRRLFYDRYGVSPKTFVNWVRLNRVRSDLKKCTGKKSKIADIANSHGYWHMGQFAADYKKLFGELPSTTLNKTCKR